jgi:uncharacterized membrane protein YbhN (UPF0104 family)
VKQSATAEQVTSSPERDAHRLRSGIVWTVALLALLLAIGLAVPDLRDVLARAARAAPGWLVLAVALELASCLGYVATVRLVLRRAPRREARWLAWAEMAFGAVVPVGGAGGLAVGAWAMRAWRIPWSRIANRSAVIFLLTSAINTAVLALASLGVMVGLGVRARGFVYGLVPAGVAVAGLSFFLLLPRIVARTEPDGEGAPGARKRRLALLLRRTAGWVKDTEAVVLRPDWRLLGSAGYLLFDMAVLWACLRAVGPAPPLLALVVGYQVGYLANLLPIPGGVGVLEGGLLGALLLYGLPAAPTAAAVVIYHAIALWVPVIGGSVGFVRLRGALTTPTVVLERVDELAAGAAPEQAGEVSDIAA